MKVCASRSFDCFVLVQFKMISSKRLYVYLCAGAFMVLAGLSILNYYDQERFYRIM